MPIFIITMNWTEQGIRNVKEAPKRAAAGRELGKKLGVDIKHLYLTSGKSDLMAIVEGNGDNVAKFCMVLGSQGNVRTTTVRAWPEAEYVKMISELP
ncbi:MAG TPA: GYD domain-containing protein [Xanthobacteraceae bacterium]|nr:GYD domain-containing protein [Xanthobacteraceae bacterium]